MPVATLPEPDRPGRGDHSPRNPFEYDAAIDDFLRDIPIENNDHTPDQGVPSRMDDPKDVDEEIKIKKQRKPVPKLDEDRLLSDAGIPKLRRIARSKLKFKGKGHEFSDIQRALGMYQLWLDDLYPRAKFRDALSMVEKVGHSRRIQVSRRAWMDETRPQGRAASEERLEDAVTRGDGPGAEPALDAGRPSTVRSAPQSSAPSQTIEQGEVPEEDELDALLAESNAEFVDTRVTMDGPRRGPFEEDSDANPDEDELDALLAEQPRRDLVLRRDEATGGNEFADEEEAMADFGW